MRKLESDLPVVEDVTFETVQKAGRLLMITAESLPLVPNVSRLCESLGTTRDSCLKMLYALDRAGTIRETFFANHLSGLNDSSGINVPPVSV